MERLLRDGCAVTIVDDLSAAGPDGAPRTAAPLHRLDVADAALADVLAETRPDIVFHLAAQTSVVRSMNDPRADAAANVLGGLNVLTQCVRFGTRRVTVFSTGGALYGEPESLPCPESHPIRPLSVYGASKHALEHYTNIICGTNGLPYTILRPGNVYGPGQNPHGEAGVVAIFAMAMLANHDVTVYGDGMQERDFIYVDDVVDAAMATLSDNAPASGSFNIASGVPTSVNDIFSLIAAETGYRREPVHAPERPGEVRRIYLDTARARAGLEWTPRTGLQEGISRTVAAFRSRASTRRIAARG